MTAAIFYPPRRKLPAWPSTGCWATWDAATIAACTNSPRSMVEANWPAVYAELERCGIASSEVQAGALGTIAIETAHTFEPVQEAFWMSDAWRWANLRYAPYWGRGYLQLTWDDNYRAAGDAIGINLVDYPDRALEPAISAKVFAWYFDTRGVAAAAGRSDWREVRRLVQGGSAGLDRLEEIVHCLGC